MSHPLGQEYVAMLEFFCMTMLLPVPLYRFADPVLDSADNSKLTTDSGCPVKQETDNDDHRYVGGL